MYDLYKNEEAKSMNYIKKEDIECMKYIWMKTLNYELHKSEEV